MVETGHSNRSYLPIVTPFGRIANAFQIDDRSRKAAAAPLVGRQTFQPFPPFRTEFLCATSRSSLPIAIDKRRN